MNVSSLFRGLCIAACAVAAVAAWADPPGRVGRITYIEGAVSFFGDRDEGWQKAQINYPVTSENSLWTEGNARGEVRMGPSAIRVGNDSILDFVKMDDEQTQGFLQRGSVNVRLRQFGTPDSGDTLQIGTREGHFMLEGNGRYRVDVVANGNESRVSVFSGRARFESGDTRLTIDAGKQLTVRITGSATDFRYDMAMETAFDRWADARDQQWNPTHQRYARTDARDDTLISPYMTGYEDLDANGDWIDDNEYGRLWAPRVVVSGWAPYRYGRWSHVRPWGWTWIDDAPWGFAPFHYGRWVQVRSRWCWWPGPYVGRPVYAPALVAWFGGAGAGLTIASGPAVGWFPLAPREYYVPRYTTNANYLRRINYVSNNVTIINPPARYRNQVPGATIVSNNVFIQGNPVGNHRTHLPPQAIAGHPPIASLDIARPPRSSAIPMPDRRPDGRPGHPAPRPRFADTPPAPAYGQAPPSPSTPKFRTAEPSAGGPLPVHKTTTGPVPAASAAPPVPAASASTPVGQPRPRPAYSSPQPPAATSNSRPVQVEPATVMPDREARAPRPRGSSRTPADVPGAPAPQSVAPATAPRQPSSHPLPVARDAGPPVAKPLPEHTAKPRHEGQAEAAQGKNEVRDGRTRPGVAKE